MVTFYNSHLSLPIRGYEQLENKSSSIFHTATLATEFIVDSNCSAVAGQQGKLCDKNALYN